MRHVLSTTHLYSDLLFECLHWLQDHQVVELQKVGEDLVSNVWVVVHERFHIEFPQTETFHKARCFIVVLAVQIEHVFVAADYTLRPQFDVIVLFLVDFEADLVVTGGYVDLLVHLLASLENMLVKLVRCA